MIKISGGNSEGDPPVPIPNTEVKPFSADNTRLETSWEDKTLPDPNIQRQDEKKSCLCFLIRRKKSREGVNRNRYGQYGMSPWKASKGSCWWWEYAVSGSGGVRQRAAGREGVRLRRSACAGPWPPPTACIALTSSSKLLQAVCVKQLKAIHTQEARKKGT